MGNTTSHTKSAYVYSILVTQIRIHTLPKRQPCTWGGKKGVEGSDPRKGREREKGPSEECEIKQVKDEFDKQKESQLHTRREKHKTLMKK